MISIGVLLFFFCFGIHFEYLVFNAVHVEPLFSNKHRVLVEWSKTIDQNLDQFHSRASRALFSSFLFFFSSSQSFLCPEEVALLGHNLYNGDGGGSEAVE